MSHPLDPLFKPKAIAVIGVSSESSIGGIIVRNILESGFKGKVIPVNRTGATIHSLKVVKDISKVSGSVDMAIIAESTGSVSDTIAGCQKKGVNAVVVATSDATNIKGNGPIILGPNSVGVIGETVNASLLPGLALRGNVALIDQSGTSAQTLITEAEQIGLGFSLVASIGNSPNISITDLLEFCEDDPNTKLILLHVVSSCQSRNFAQLCRRISRKKPIILLQPGSFALVRRTISCGEATTRDYDLDISYLFSQCGVHIARTITGLLAIARVLVSSPVPDGNRVGIIGNQGGPTEILINACNAHGLRVNRSESNPLMVSAVPTTAELKAAIDKIQSSADHDLLAISIVPPPGLETDESVDQLTTLVAQIDKPVLAVAGSQAVSANKKGRKRKNTIPFFRFSETAAIAMAALNKRRAWLARDVGKIVSFAVTSEIAQSVIDGVIAENRRDLTLPETLMVLDAYGINVPRYSYAKDLEEALSAAHGLGYPVSMSLLSKDLINKKEVGGVFANVKNADDLTSNFLTLVSRAQRHQLNLDGILIQELIKGDDSISFGVFDDTEFGTLIIFGQEEPNGLFARNIRMKPWPLTDVDAVDIARSFSSRIPPLSTADDNDRSYELIEETLLRLSQLVKDFDSIGEIIINRFVVFPDHEQSKAVDAQIKLK